MKDAKKKWPCLSLLCLGFSAPHFEKQQDKSNFVARLSRRRSRILQPTAHCDTDKKMKRTPNHLLACCAIACICAASHAASTASGTHKSCGDTLTTFTPPQIPEIFPHAEARNLYLAAHYWENINFADTNYIHHPEITERAWVGFCKLLNRIPLPSAQEAMRTAMKQAYASKKSFGYLAGLADKYLYNPNSPLRNEELYIPVLEAMLAAPMLSSVEKIRPKARLEMAKKNRPGMPAQDFTFALPTGQEGTLYDIGTDYTLLFFNNPGCHACNETLRMLKTLAQTNRLLQAGRLTLLTVYPDEELDEWRKHLHEFPVQWTNAYDPQLAIRDKQLYDLKAIPTLYLLDKEKRVILKDTTPQAIENYLKKQ